MNPVVAPSGRWPNNPTPPLSTTIDRPPPSLPADSLEPRRSNNPSRLTITPPLTIKHLPTLLRYLITLPFHAWNHQRPSSGCNAVRIRGRIANWVRSTWRIWPCTSSPRSRRPVARSIIGHRSRTRIFVGRQDRSTTILRPSYRRGTSNSSTLSLLNCVANVIGSANFATPVPNSSTLFARRNDGSNARRATVAPCTPTTTLPTPMGKTRFCHRASTRICKTGIADTGVTTRTARFSRIICKCSVDKKEKEKESPWRKRVSPLPPGK